jgi:hypothetical protein
MNREPPALDRRGQVIRVGDRVLVLGGLTVMWGPFARVISTADEAGIPHRAIVIRAERLLRLLPDVSRIYVSDPIIAAREVEVTPTTLIARHARRSMDNQSERGSDEDP